MRTNVTVLLKNLRRLYGFHYQYAGRFSSYLAVQADAMQRNLQSSVPDLPPKAPLSKYRPVFLERRRQLLQHWLSSVLLHPEIGACKAVRLWVMD